MTFREIPVRRGALGLSSIGHAFYWRWSRALPQLCARDELPITSGRPCWRIVFDLAGVLCLILGLVPGPVGAIQPEWCQATAACSVPGKSARACWLAWHLAGMLPWMSSQNLIGRPTRARSRRSVCRSLFGPEPRLLSRSGCSVVRQPQNGRRYGGFASRPPQATCNVQASAHPPDHANPESLIADLIGIIFPAGQPAADLHGARPPRLIPVAALDLHQQFYTSKVFPEMLC